MRGKMMRLFVCAGALCLALAGCGGKEEEQAPAATQEETAAEEVAKTEEQAAEPQVSDEELIKQDFSKRFSDSFNPTFVKTLIQGDEDQEEVFSAVGMSADEYAELTCKLIIAEPKKAKIEGDEAVLTVELTMPDWDAADEQKIVENLLTEKTEGTDVNAMSDDERVELFGEVMREVMTYPTMPSYTETFDVPYKKTAGTWAPADPDDITGLVGIASDDAEEVEDVDEAEEVDDADDADD